jgi:hypothetical protein
MGLFQWRQSRGVLRTFVGISPIPALADAEAMVAWLLVDLNRHLVFSQDFTINGQEVNLGKIVPHGVTSNNSCNTISVGGPGNFRLAFPFVATGIAIGNDEASGRTQFGGEADVLGRHLLADSRPNA